MFICHENVEKLWIKPMEDVNFSERGLINGLLFIPLAIVDSEVPLCQSFSNRSSYLMNRVL
jgi:hypothetical protein